MQQNYSRLNEIKKEMWEIHENFQSVNYGKCLLKSQYERGKLPTMKELKCARRFVTGRLDRMGLNRPKIREIWC